MNSDKKLNAVMKYPYATTAHDINKGYKRDRIIAFIAICVSALLVVAVFFVANVTAITVSALSAIALVFVSLYFMSQAKLAVTRKGMTEKEVIELQLKLDSSLIIDPESNEVSIKLNSNDMVTARVNKKLINELKKPRKINK